MYMRNRGQPAIRYTLYREDGSVFNWGVEELPEGMTLHEAITSHQGRTPPGWSVAIEVLHPVEIIMTPANWPTKSPTRPAYYPWNMPEEDDCRCCGCRKSGHHPHGCEGVGGNCGCSLANYRSRGKEANDLRLARADIYDENRRLVRRATEEG